MADQPPKQPPPPPQQGPPKQQQGGAPPPPQQGQPRPPQQGPPPQQQGAPRQPGPPREKRPPPSEGATITSADVVANPRFSVIELVDLALCSPEVGAVNFNILRILLRDIVTKAGIDKSPVKVNDLESRQVENFKNYVQGSAVASPMPGVLRIGPSGQGVPGAGPGGASSNPGLRAPGQGGQGGGPPPPGGGQGRGTPRTPKSGLPPSGGGGAPGGGPTGSFAADPNMALGDKVARLEKHLEALYQLPANSELIEKAKLGSSMSVNDMWQIIQLNNRIAAAEAAIQKMASLIEDLAKNMGKVKVDTKGLKKDADELATTNSDLVIQGQRLSDSYDRFSDVIGGIKNDIEQLKKGWKLDRDNLEKTLGVDLGKIPSFMKAKQKKEREPGQEQLPGESPSEQFERGTQTFVKIDKEQQRQAEGRGEKGGKREGGRGPPDQQQQRRESKDRQRGEGRDRERQDRDDRDRRGPPPREGEQRGQGPPQPPPKPKKAPEQFIPPQQIAQMTAEEIAREVTPEEIRTIPPEVYREMTPEQKKAVQEIRKMAKPPQQQAERKPPMGVNKMTKEQISDLPPEHIAERMPYEEAVNLPPEVLENMSEEQKQNVKKVIERGPPPKRPTSRKDLAMQRKQEGQAQGQGQGQGQAQRLSQGQAQVQGQGQKQQKQRPPPSPPPPMGIASMEQEEIREIPATQIASSMPYEEAVNIPPKVLEKMTSEQKAAVQKVINQGPPPQSKGKGKEGLAPPPQKALGVASMTQQELQDVHPTEIAAQMSYDEAKSIPPKVLEQMTTEQQAAVKKVVNAGPVKSAAQAGPKAPQMGIISMTQEQLKEVPPEEIASKMTYEEAKAIPPKVLEKMTAQQKEAVKKVISTTPKPAQASKPALGVAYMTKDQLQEVPPEKIKAEMNYQEAKNIPPKVLEKMTTEQKAAVKKVVEAGPPPEEQAAEDDEDDEYDDYYDDYVEPQQPQGPRQQQQQQQKRASGEKRKSSFEGKAPALTNQEVQELAQMTPEQLRQTMTPDQAVNLPQEELAAKFTPDQVKEIEKLKEEAAGINVEKAADMTPAELVSSLTPEQIQNMPDDQLEKLSAVKEARRSQEKEQPTDSGFPEEYYEPEYTTADDVVDGDESAVTGSSLKRKSKPLPKREKTKHHHAHHKHHRRDEEGEDEERGGKHTRIDVVQGPIPTVGEALPPITLEDYLANLPPEEAANLAADAVQKELQKQYQQLQGMQRQLAQDIQEKMEFIYQKLLREIVSQQLTTSPYMAVGGPEQCLGPGICTGHGMPAGIAVVQFPESKDRTMTPGSAGEDVKVCPGPPICPGKDVCPYCRVGGQKDGLQGLKGLDKKPGEVGGKTDGAKSLAITDGRRITELDEALIQEMKSLMLLDLEKIRDEMRSKKLGTYDEQDILERLSAVWEALKILKHNEEAIAIKISKQDALFKRLPTKTIEKLSKIPDENLEAIATGNFNKPMYIPEDSGHRQSLQKEAEEMFKLPFQPMGTGGSGGGGGADKEDIQTLFNNLANVIAECTEQKDRIDQLADTARILESGMVTKQMLLDALSDKADKGLINTKVSYDEFGNTIDELHTQLHNLMVEGYQRNENWKKVTADLAEELAEKLDKVELAPIRAFFKSHLKNLEEKVRNLTKLIEEPDPAGTRKKLLRDYNCISCDRMVNIAGVTNGPTLPMIGPISAGHPTASKRALELHRMRMRKQFDPNTKNLNALEKHGRSLQQQNKAEKKLPNPQQIANDVDVMHVVNRYTGGSHTAIDNSSRIAAQRGSGGKGGSGNAIEELFENTTKLRSTGAAPPMTSTVSGGARDSGGAVPAAGNATAAVPN